VAASFRGAASVEAPEGDELEAPEEPPTEELEVPLGEPPEDEPEELDTAAPDEEPEELGVPPPELQADATDRIEGKTPHNDLLLCITYILIVRELF
jgi:hypothetical protein